MGKTVLNNSKITLFLKMSAIFSVLLTTPNIGLSQTGYTENTPNPWKYFNTGQLPKAIKVAKKNVKKMKKAGDDDYLTSLFTALEICRRSYDFDCMYEHTIKLIDYRTERRTGGLNDMLDVTKSIDYYLSLSALWEGEESKLDAIETYYDDNWEYPADPFYYVRRQVNLALIQGGLLNPSEGRLAVDRALSTILSMNNPAKHELFIALSLSEIIEAYLVLGDPLQAYALYSTTGDFIPKTIPMLTPDFALFRFREAGLLLHLKDFAGAKRATEISIDVIQEITWPNKLLPTIYESMSLMHKAMACVGLGELDCALESINGVKAWGSPKDLQKRGDFTDLNEYRYFLLYTFIHNLVQQPLSEEFESIIAKAKITGPTMGLDKEIAATGQIVAWVNQANRTNWSEQSHKEVSASISEVAHTITSGYEDRNVEGSDVFNIYSTTQKLVAFFTLGFLGSVDKQTDQDISSALAMFDIINRNLRQENAEFLSKLANTEKGMERKVVRSGIRLSTGLRQLQTAELKLLLNEIEGHQATKYEPLDFVLPTFDTGKRSAIAAQGIIRNKISRNSSLSVAREASVKFPTFDDFKESLDDDEAYITVIAAGPQLFYLCITNDSGILVKKEVDSNQFMLDSKLYLSALTATHSVSLELDSQFPVHAAHRLYKNILEPVKDCLAGKSKVIWAPETSLYDMPLSALLTNIPEEKENGGYALNKANWLINDYDISYATSARGMIAARKLSKSLDSHTRLFMGVGNPVLSGSTELGADRQTLLTRGTVDNLAGSIASLSELPETSAELNQIANLAGSSSLVLEGKQATEKNIRTTYLPQFQAITFATHGLIKEEIPGLQEAALVVTPESETDDWNDGILTSSEIADITFDTKLITLSACNTANFEYDLFSQEVKGMTSAFALAGAPTVLATLWPVESQTSKAIVSSTYETLLENATIGAAEALASAQRSFIKAPPSPPLSHPRFWAPFVIYGDGTVTLETESTSTNNKIVINNQDDNSIPTAILSSHDDGSVLIVSERGTGSSTTLALSELDSLTGVLSTITTDLGVATDFDSIGNRYIFDGKNDSTSKLNVRKITKQGNEAWSTNLSEKNETLLAADAEQLSLNKDVIVLATRSKATEPPNLQVFLINEAGAVINSKSIPLEGHSSDISVDLYPEKNQITIAINDSTPIAFEEKAIEERVIIDEYHQFRPCLNTPNATILTVDTPKLTLTETHTIKAQLVNDIATSADRNFVLTTEYDSCELDFGLAIHELSTNGTSTIETLYRHGKLLPSFGQSIEILDSGELLIAGGVTRFTGTVDIYKAQSPVDLSQANGTNSKRDRRSIEDAWIAKISLGGKITQEIWLNAGSDFVIKDTLSHENKIHFIGTLGNRAITGVIAQ